MLKRTNEYKEKCKEVCRAEEYINIFQHYSAELWYPVSFTRYVCSVAEKEGHPRMADVAEITLRKILHG